MITYSENKKLFEEAVSKVITESIRKQSNNIRKGKILSFDAIRSTASVEMYIDRTVLSNVPVANNVTTGKAGDTCLVITPDPAFPQQVYITAIFSTAIKSVASEWVNYTPDTPGITVGSGTVKARYVRTGNTVTVFFEFTFGAGSAMGDGSFVLPFVVSDSALYTYTRNFVGDCYVLDSGTAQFNGGTRIASATTAQPLITNTTGTYSTINAFSSTVPMTWTTNDLLMCQFTYECNP